jgi:FAD:protein FMN transferase
MHRFHAMGSPCETQWLGDSAAYFAQLVEAETRRIEAKYSRFLASSVLSQINQSAGQGAMHVDPETAHLLNYAAVCFASSGGLFDITAGVLNRVWDFKASEPKPPTTAALADCLKHVGWQHCTWQDPWFSLPAGMQIDFGGLAKEYAVDRAVGLAQQAGATRGLVNLGGDVRCLGAPGWRVGVQHPRDTEASIATFQLTDAALATSGDYERYFSYQGRRYCHLLNPITGQPADAVQSVSVLAPSCLVAGSLASIAFLKADLALDFLRESGYEFLLVDAAGRVFAS